MYRERGGWDNVFFEVLMKVEALSLFCDILHSAWYRRSRALYQICHFENLMILLLINTLDPTVQIGPGGTFVWLDDTDGLPV